MAQRAFALVYPPQRRVSIAAALLVAAGFLAASVAIIAPWLFSPAALNAEIAARIRDLTGLETIVDGEPVIVYFPQPHVIIANVRFADPTGALRIETRRLEGYLRLASLLTGRVEVAKVRLGGPELFIDADGRPMPPHSAIGRAASAKSATPQASSADEAQLGSVELVDGKAHVLVDSGASDFVIEKINLTIDWPRLGAAAKLHGRLGWKGETAMLDAKIAHPVELIRGEPSDLALRLSAPVFSLIFDGTLASMPQARLSGRLAASVASASKLATLLGATSLLPAPFDELGFNCNATIVDLRAECADLGLTFGGSEFEGDLVLDARGGDASLTGTLATKALSIEPYLAQFPSALGGDGQWSRTPFDLPLRSVPHIDLRLSAGRIALGQVVLEDARFSLRSNEGRFEIAVPNVRSLGGTIASRTALGVRGGEIDLRTTAEFEGIGVSAKPRGSDGGWRIAGSMTGSAELESSGHSVSELMHNLEGTARIGLSGGEFAGIDLDRAFHRLDKRPLSLAEEIHRGATAFETANFGLAIKNGVAEVQNGRLRTPLVDLSVGGSADIAERSLNLHAIATAGSEAPNDSMQNNGKFRFDVAGSFDDPQFLPDVPSLIRRSGAAAPLFRHSPEAPGREGEPRAGTQ
jgi:AsmA protein